MGEKQTKPFQLSFNGLLKVDFQGSHVTSDGGLILVRELDERLGFGELIDEHLSDSRQGAGAYRSNQDHHRPEDSYAPAKRWRRESRVALRAPMPVQDVVKPLARPKNDGSGFETV